MRIQKMLHQYRRDFRAIFECEGCGCVHELRGYDDRNFHDNVIPEMACPDCGLSSIDMGIAPQFTQTKYPEGFQI